MKLLSKVEVIRLSDQPLEEFSSLYTHPFGMPLHTHDRLKLTTLYRFNHPIGRKSRYTETFSRIFHRLMMEAIDHYTLFLIERIEYGRLCKRHTMRCFTTFGVLRMLKCCSMIGCYRLVFTEFLFNRFILSNIIFIDILLYLSTQSDSKGLCSTADTEDRQLAIKSQTDKHQFG